MNRSSPINSSQDRQPRQAEHYQSSPPPPPQNDKPEKEQSQPCQQQASKHLNNQRQTRPGPQQHREPHQQKVWQNQPNQQQRLSGQQRYPEHQRYQQPSQRQTNDTFQKPPPSGSLKSSSTDDDDLLRSMQALSTNDTDDNMKEEDYILECTAKMDKVQPIFEKYECMRGGCRFQSVDETTSLVIFGHPSTAQRAWVETRNKSPVVVRVYRGPMDIIEDIPIVRKSMVHHQPRPTNKVAQRLIHGSLGLRAPSNKTNRNTQP